jgi:putative transposase
MCCCVAQGWIVNHKRVLRLYRDEGLSLRIPRKKRKFASTIRVPLVPPSGPNEGWTLDFVADARSDERRFRVLTVLDVFTRECLVFEAAWISSGLGVRSRTPSSSTSTATSAMNA